jgi:hypothetical protein
MNAASPTHGATIGEKETSLSIGSSRDRRNDRVLSNANCAGSADQRVTRAKRLL